MYDRFRGRPLKAALAVVVLLILGGLLIQAPDLVGTFGAAKKPAAVRLPEVSQPAQAVVAVHPPVRETTAEPAKPVAPPVQAGKKKLPETLGRIAISQGGTVWWILSDVYGQWNLGVYNAFQRANPDIENLNKVPAGKVLLFPAVQAANPTTARGVWVQLASAATLEEAYGIMRERQRQVPGLRMIAQWIGRVGTVFSIVLGERFTDEATAIVQIRKLPTPLRSHAKVLSGKWESDTVFFSQL